MADKGNAWLSGAGVIPGPQSRSIGLPAESRNGRIIRTILILAAGSVFTFFVLGSTPEPWAWEALRVMTVALVLLASFYFPAQYLKPSFVIWWLMLMSECIFFREGDAYATANAYAGAFPTAVYGEVIMWGLCLLAVLICSVRVRGYLHRLFEGDYKWITLFAIVCTVSCVYSLKPAFSLVWAFKLDLIVLLLILCSIQISDQRDTLNFLRFTFFAYAVVAFQPVVVSALRGQMFDEDGRMSMIVNPDALSADAATVFVLALTLFSKVKHEGLRMSAIVFGLSGFVVMVLAGGKAGILSGLIAGALFFLFRKGFGSTLAFVVAAGVAGLLLISFTPLGDYFTQYHQGGTASTLSGRTLLWSAVIPAIQQNAILGHGYVASTFVAMQVNAVGWAAPQLHNGFLEAAYNDGIFGFVLILILNVVILRNLYRVVRRTPPSDPVYRLGAGCLALYIMLLINGFFNASFGGRARPPFILFLALILISDKLLKSSSRPAPRLATWEANQVAAPKA
jgi:O-antigen ligase